MRQATLPIPEVGIIAATRGLGGAGAALLLADRVSKENRKRVGWTLFLIGLLSTVPLVMDIVKKSETV
ncbi:hypothetical protein [Fimbriimonas ginsengisoli]|uniref:hypothetical protein n=1 Tax=Fimbriimonas ginsengisoli TaxID=1005039 RepID=UPI00046D50FF|nr:hypothetical protein [Fimbriimonas ginsengisoli]